MYADFSYLCFCVPCLATLSVHFSLHSLCAEHSTLQWVSVIHQLNMCPFVSAWEKGPLLIFYAWIALEQCHKGVCVLED